MMFNATFNNISVTWCLISWFNETNENHEIWYSMNKNDFTVYYSMNIFIKQKSNFFEQVFISGERKNIDHC